MTLPGQKDIIAAFAVATQRYKNLQKMPKTQANLLPKKLPIYSPN